MKRFLLIVLFLLTSIASYGQVIVDANRDPLAARNDGSNITATSAFRAALGIPFIDRIRAITSGSTCRTILGSSTAADDGVNTLQVYGPASMTTVYVTATSTFQGDIITGTNCMIRKATGDGADTTSIAINGGGGNSYNRGAGISMSGNEVTSIGGTLYLFAGNIDTGIIKFATDAGVERMRIGTTGAVSIATTTPATGYDLTIASGACIFGTASVTRLLISGVDVVGDINAALVLIQGN